MEFLRNNDITKCNSTSIISSKETPTLIRMTSRPRTQLGDYLKLHKAIRKNDQGAVSEVLKNSKISISDSISKSGSTLLHLSCSAGFLELVEFLVNKNASLTSKDFDGNTPLHIAAMGGNVDIVRYLFHIDNNLGTIENREGETPVSLATKNGHNGVLKLLGQQQDNHLALTLFWKAIGKGNTVICSKLIKDPNVNIQYTSDIYKQVPLHIACIRGHKPIVKLLLEHKAQIDIKDKREWTPLHCAAIQGQTGIINLLIKKVHDPNLVDGEGNTCLHYLVQHKYTEKLQKAMESLIKAGANLDYTNINIAMAYNRIETIEFLQKKCESTPYHLRKKVRSGKKKISRSKWILADTPQPILREQRSKSVGKSDIKLSFSSYPCIKRRSVDLTNSKEENTKKELGVEEDSSSHSHASSLLMSSTLGRDSVSPESSPRRVQRKTSNKSSRSSRSPRSKAVKLGSKEKRSILSPKQNSQLMCNSSTRSSFLIPENKISEIFPQKEKKSPLLKNIDTSQVIYQEEDGFETLVGVPFDILIPFMLDQDSPQRIYFILTYRKLMNSLNFFNAIIEIFTNSEKDEGEQEERDILYIQIRVIKMICEWIQLNVLDFKDPELVVACNQFLEKLKEVNLLWHDLIKDAWEEAVAINYTQEHQREIFAVREEEVVYLKKGAKLSALNFYFSLVATTIAIFITVFTALTLFNVTRLPLLLLPDVVKYVAESIIALRRLQNFLEEPEIVEGKNKECLWQGLHILIRIYIYLMTL